MSALENPAFPSEHGGSRDFEKSKETFDLDEENHIFDEGRINNKRRKKRRIVVIIVLTLLIIGVATALYFTVHLFSLHASTSGHIVVKTWRVTGFIDAEHEYERSHQPSNITNIVASSQLPVTTPSAVSIALWRHVTDPLLVTTQSEQEDEITDTTGSMHDVTTATTVTSSTSGLPLVNVPMTIDSHVPDESNTAFPGARETSSVKISYITSAYTNDSSDPIASVVLENTIKATHASVSVRVPMETNASLTVSLPLNATQSNIRADLALGTSQTIVNTEDSMNVTNNATRSVNTKASPFETTTALEESTPGTAVFAKTATTPSDATQSAKATSESAVVVARSTVLTDLPAAAIAKTTPTAIQTSPLPTGTTTLRTASITSTTSPPPPPTTTATATTTTTTTTATTTTTTTTTPTPSAIAATPPFGQCFGTDVLCSDFACIKASETCDGKPDCIFGEDEMGCPG